MNSISKIAKLLRTPEEVIFGLEKKMEKISGKKGVIGKIIEENDERVRRGLKDLRLQEQSSSNSAEDVYQALAEKTKETDQALFRRFGEPEFGRATGCRVIINSAKELTGDLPGFFLKKEKAKELIKLNPPKNIMAVLGYGNDVDKMLANENIFEIFSALRFVEDEAWLNDIFFKQYENLKKEDFEERKIEVMVLPEKWLGIGQKFLGKKLHHMSHLKELGVAFAVPVERYGPGETLYFFFMTLHYLYEIAWHSKLFKIYSRSDNFAEKMINALKVSVSGMHLPNDEKISWRIVAKYLGKKDANDPRLFEPHISPEAWHYTETSQAIQSFAERFPETGLNFWDGLGCVGEFFLSGDKETLLAFSIYDNGIALLKQSGFESKYLYHQQEALWNKIFIEYMGEDVMNDLIMKNMDKGYITL